jgi:hypothetical protein
MAPTASSPPCSSVLREVGTKVLRAMISMHIPRENPASWKRIPCGFTSLQGHEYDQEIPDCGIRDYALALCADSRRIG